MLLKINIEGRACNGMTVHRGWIVTPVKSYGVTEHGEEWELESALAPFDGLGDDSVLGFALRKRGGKFGLLVTYNTGTVEDSYDTELVIPLRPKDIQVVQGFPSPV